MLLWGGLLRGWRGETSSREWRTSSPSPNFQVTIEESSYGSVTTNKGATGSDGGGRRRKTSGNRHTGPHHNRHHHTATLQAHF